MSARVSEGSAAERLRLAIAARARAEVAEAVAIVAFAAESEWSPNAEIEVVGSRPARIGAEGTPVLDEFVAHEVAALKGISVGAATWLIRDLVNLKFRHPRLWCRVRSGAIPVFPACQLVAEIARFDLSPDQLELLDDQLVDNLARLSWRRLVNLCRGLIGDLAPEQVEERSRLARAERYVRRLATDDPSVAFVAARVDTADAVFFDAMVDRIADLLETHGDTDSKDLRRAKSLGILATPARATLFLAEAAGHLDDEVSVFDSETSENDSSLVSVSSAGAEQRSAGCDVMYGLDGGQIAPPDVPATVLPAHSPVGVDSSTLAATVVPSRDGTDERTASVWRAARQTQPRIRWTDPRLLPKSTIYLHVAEDTVMHGRGPVRAEGIGPLSATMIGLLVGHTRITVKPVIRPYDDVAVDAYEIPRRIREQVILRDLVEVFPYSSRPARNQQLDHTRAYRKGPPGQTGPANLGPLSAKVHRAKTHGHWNLNQPKPGVFWWRSPAGNRYRVTPSGVTRINLHTALGRAFGETLWQYDQRPDQPGQCDP